VASLGASLPASDPAAPHDAEAALERAPGSLVHANAHAASASAPELQIEAAPPLHPVWHQALALGARPPSANVGQQ
jgi:hypothetical protein